AGSVSMSYGMCRYSVRRMDRDTRSYGEIAVLVAPTRCVIGLVSQAFGSEKPFLRPAGVVSVGQPSQRGTVPDAALGPLLEHRGLDQTRELLQVGVVRNSVFETG